jgi:HEAT repeat protein
MLLKDDDFFVRETAAWPISDLAGPTALPELLVALQQGFDQGHDCDGLQAALADMVEINKASAREVLAQLATSNDANIRKNAAWLLEFCEEQPAP